MLKIHLENRDFLCYPKLVSVNFDLFNDLHHQEKYDQEEYN